MYNNLILVQYIYLYYFCTKILTSYAKGFKNEQCEKHVFAHGQEHRKGGEKRNRADGISAGNVVRAIHIYKV